MPVTALCRFTSVLRTLDADEVWTQCCHIVTLQGILLNIQINQIYILNILNAKRI